LSFFFFSSRRRHTRLQGDWSSDVCSSDLYRPRLRPSLGRAGCSPIPQDSKRGYIRHVQEMAVTVDDKAMELAAGAIIRNQQNLRSEERRVGKECRTRR